MPSRLPVAARGRLGVIDAGLLMWIIALAVLTLAAGLLAYSRHTDVVAYRDGDPDDPRHSPANSLTTVLEYNARRKAENEELQRRIDAHIQTLRTLDYTLSGLGAYWANRPQGGEWLYGGDPDTAAWRGTQRTIAQRAQRLQAWSESKRRPEATRFDELDRVMRSFQNDQQRVLTEAADLQARFEADREALMLELDRFARERREVEARHNLDFSTLAIARLRLDAEIRELLDLRLEWFEECDAFAEVMRVDLENRFLIIGRGRADGVKPGVRFEVFTTVGGKYQVKGMVEVVELGDHIAKCRILEQVDPRRLAIHRGDQVGNPVFSPQRPKVFVLAGEFKRYNRSDLEQFINNLGGVVRSEVGPGVDFLVAGDRSEGVQDRAREFRLQAMHEDTLVRFLNPHFRPR